MQHSHSPSSSSPNPTITTHRQALSNASPSPSPDTSNHSPHPSTSDAPLVGQPMSFVAYLKTWDDSEVSRWLHEHRCGSHANLFVAHDIRGDVLLELDNAALKEMGIASVGDRVRILGAVKQLRHQLALSKSSPTATISHTNGILTPDAHPTQKQSKRLEGARPPPLHLSYNARSPIPARAVVPEPAASSSTTPNRTPQPTSSGAPASHRHLPPAQPPPRGQPPLPPASASSTTSTTAPSTLAIPPLPPHHSGRRTPIQESTTPVSAGGAWTGEYGLPARPTPGNVGSSKLTTPTLTRSASPSQLTGPSYIPAKRSGTANGLPSNSSSSLRPPTHERAHSLPGSNINPNSHPYSSASQVLQSNINSFNPLSPIEEAMTPSSLPAASPFSNSSEYRVGRGPFPPPVPKTNVPHSTPTIEDIRRATIKFNLPEEGVSSRVNISDCVDGVKVMEKVLKKFNKLANTPRAEGDADYLNIDDASGLVVDGWGVFLPSKNWDNPEARPLTEAELLNICHADPTHPVREQGLTLRMVPVARSRRKKSSASSFADQPPITIRRSPPPSPTKPSPPTDVAPSEGMLNPNDTSKRTKRASAISILSGLGVHGPERPGSPESDSASVRSLKPSRTSRLRNFFGQRPPSELITHHLQDYFPNAEKKVIKRAYRKSMLRQNKDRQSLLMDHDGWNLNNRDSQALPSRFSMSSLGSTPRRSLSEKRGSTMFAPTPIGQQEDFQTREDRQIPRVSVSTESGEFHDLTQDEAQASRASTPRSTQLPQLLPPVSLDQETFSESFELLPGIGEPGPLQASMSDAKGKVPDASSMLTIDEITAEVESRRNSIIASGSGVSETGVRARDSLSVPFPIIEDKTLEEAIEEEDSDYDSDEYEVEGALQAAHEDGGGDNQLEEEDILSDEDEGPSKAVTSKGGVRSIKWVKGALIGKGSFGSVFLAMDAQRGLLMAVKQVELPTSATQNEERKKSMITALEREIDLLKDLQHENIVQYLDSSMDDTSFNIFLEYVPGGSVTALLRNYGAFEESLVGTFVRQILQGLAYLHGRDIIHRDIKGANILVDNKSCVKISDFGISKKVEDSMLGGTTKAHRPSFQGSAFWMAPEVVKQTSYTAKADIWSLGCLCVEMLTGEHPWANLTQMQAIFKIGSSAKPSVPSDITSDGDDFMQKTFDLDSEARPSAAKLLEHPWVAFDPLMSFAAANAALTRAEGATMSAMLDR